MRRENGMLPRLKAYRRRYGGGLKRYALYHKTQSAFLLAPPPPPSPCTLWTLEHALNLLLKSECGC